MMDISKLLNNYGRKKKSTWASETQVSRVLKDILEAHSWIRAIG